jgi:hypothetical protein
MQNYSLLRDCGRVARPVMLKRGYGATIEEWLMAAEYIVSSGNPNVILCERGIRTFETYTRNTFDLAAVPLLDRLTHLPVIVDPSHATGKRWLVKPLALGGIAVGADGVMVEVHPRPDDALSDAEQQLTLEQFRDMMDAIVPLHAHVRGDTTQDPTRECADLRQPVARVRSSPDCAATCDCPATSRSATRRSSNPPWPPAKAASRAPATAPTCARRRVSWRPSAWRWSASGPTVRRWDTGSRRPARTACVDPPAASTAATQGPASAS